MTRRRARGRGRCASRAGTGRRGTAGTGRPGRARARDARRARSIRPNRCRSTPHGSTATGAASPGRHGRGQRRRDGGDEVEPARGRQRDRARAGMGEIGAVQRDQARPGRHGQGRPGGEAEVGVDDVDSRVRRGRAAAGQPARRPDVAAERRRGRTPHVDLRLAGPAQRLDLVTDEPAEPRALGGRVHVGDDQGAHRGGRASVSGTGAASSATMSRWPPRSIRQAAGRRVRLRGRGPDRPARAARVAARPRTTSTSGTRRASPTASARQDELRRFAVEIADHLLELGAKLLVVACNAASSAALDTLERHLERARDRPGRDRRRRPGHPARGGREPQRPDRPARHPGDGRRRAPTRRAVLAADRHVHVEAVACPDLAPIIQGGFPFDESVVETVRGYCRAAARRRRRHGDPRLHALSAGRPDAAADARPRRQPGHLRRRAWPAASSGP